MNIWRIVAGSLLAGFLCGCGGGGGGTSGVPTAPGTAVSLATFKGLYTGTAAGSQAAFSLAGTDSQGNAWTGSFAFAADGATPFEGQSVTRSRVLITLTRASTGASSSDVQSLYFQTANGSFYKSVTSSGVTGVPVTQTALPDTVHVGDTANHLTVTNSDGTTETVTWKLEPEFNGNSKLTLSSVEKNSANVVTSQEDDTFFLDANGTPYRYEAKVTAAGITLSLAGNRN